MLTHFLCNFARKLIIINKIIWNKDIYSIMNLRGRLACCQAHGEEL